MPKPVAKLFDMLAHGVANAGETIERSVFAADDAAEDHSRLARRDGPIEDAERLRADMQAVGDDLRRAMT